MRDQERADVDWLDVKKGVHKLLENLCDSMAGEIIIDGFLASQIQIPRGVWARTDCGLAAFCGIAGSSSDQTRIFV